MAKSKQSKQRRKRLQPRREQTFFETLPLTQIPSLSLRPRDAIGRDELLTWGLAAWTDLRTLIAWLRHRLWNRRARAIYFATIGGTALGAVVIGTLMAASTYALYASDLASPAALLAKKQVGTTILDRNGAVLYEAYGAQHTTVDPLNSLPTNLKNATLAAEDPKFYSEPGISWRAMARAAVVDATHGKKLQGGSTLTQQLIKNAVLTDDKSFSRKFKEAVLATELEKRYSKDQILEMYLNETYYGEGASGIEAASQTYFHKPASALSLSQSALLAGLPLGPSRLDPNVDQAAATDRRNFVLERMGVLGQISAAQADAAKAEPINAFAQHSDIKAPWFVFYVLDQLKGDTRLGKTSDERDQMIKQGGLTITTTLDLGKEQTAESIVSGQIDKLGSHNVTNGALVSLDPSTGDIIAMVGSANYNAPGWGNFNVATSARQPGSSFKPFAYVTAFEKGWTGATTIQDTPFSSPAGDGTMYTPQNYDLHFHGTVTVRHALDNSLNIPAVKTLQYATIPATIKTASDMGISTLGSPNQYGLSLVLGAAEVTPLDMAAAYGAFDTGGIKVNPRSILKISDRYGKDLTGKTDITKKSVLDPRYAYMITNILADNQARVPEFPFNSALRLTNGSGTEIPAAAKTGTTNSFKDNWTVGYTPGVVTAVWVGNNDGSLMQNVDGITGAGPIWHDYMESAVGSQPIQQFAAPEGVTTIKVCLADGGLANPWDASTATEVFPADKVPTKHCNSADPSLTPSPSPEPTPGGITGPITTPIITPKPGHGRGPLGN